MWRSASEVVRVTFTSNGANVADGFLGSVQFAECYVGTYVTGEWSAVSIQFSISFLRYQKASYVVEFDKPEIMSLICLRYIVHRFAFTPFNLFIVCQINLKFSLREIFEMPAAIIINIVYN